ncbi:MAG: DUF5989 family protein [Candidatus Xenobium sp.]|jgi:hypothetical protein|nr:hypothetical protein [Burkholderiales bacterium]
MDSQTDVKQSPDLEESTAQMPDSSPGQTKSAAVSIPSTQPAEAPTRTPPLSFENNRDFLRFLFTRIREKKKWWLLPLLLLLYLLSMFFNIPGKESVLPALYFIF